MDRLTIIAHDRFDELIRRAREPGSIVLQTVIIGEGGDVSRRGETIVEAHPVFEEKLFGPSHGFGEGAGAPFAFEKPEDRRIAEVTLNVVEELSRKLTGGLSELNQPEAQKAIQERVRRIIRESYGPGHGPRALLKLSAGFSCAGTVSAPPGFSEIP